MEGRAPYARASSAPAPERPRGRSKTCSSAQTRKALLGEDSHGSRVRAGRAPGTRCEGRGGVGVPEHREFEPAGRVGAGYGAADERRGEGGNLRLMNYSRMLVFVTALVALEAFPASVGASAERHVDSPWRGVFKGDSLFVRTTWISTVGSSSCYQNETSDADTVELRQKYVEYRIEDLRGNVWDRGVLSEPESLQFCCDEVVAEVTPWPGRLIVKLTAYGWGCEPAGNCSAWRFIYVASADSVAESTWTDIPWDPATGSFADAWVTENCLQYPMRLKARVQGATLDFEPAFPPGVKDGDLLEKEVNQDEEFGYCLRPFSPEKPTPIAWYRTPDSKSPERLTIRSDESVEIVSAVIRAERSEAGELAPKIVRVGVRVSGRRGFLTRVDLRSLGFLGL
jgi:hypothetical protein